MRKRTALAQTLALDPDIILMDESFSALDIQTRQLMEDEVLELWAAKRKAVLFITHDLDEAVAMSDRVVVLTTFALLLDGIVGRVERHLMKWQPRPGKTESL